MSEWISVVGWTLIHFVWQGTPLAVATAGILRVCQHRSANTRYVTACVGLALMFVAPVVTAGVLWSPTGQPAVAESATISVAPEPAAVSPISGAYGHLFLSAHTWDLVETALPYVVSIWLGGVLLLATRLAGGVRRLRLTALAQAV